MSSAQAIPYSQADLVARLWRHAKLFDELLAKGRELTSEPGDLTNAGGEAEDRHVSIENGFEDDDHTTVDDAALMVMWQELEEDLRLTGNHAFDMLKLCALADDLKQVATEMRACLITYRGDELQALDTRKPASRAAAAAMPTRATKDRERERREPVSSGNSASSAPLNRAIEDALAQLTTELGRMADRCKSVRGSALLDGVCKIAADRARLDNQFSRLSSQKGKLSARDRRLVSGWFDRQVEHMRWTDVIFDETFNRSLALVKAGNRVRAALDALALACDLEHKSA